MITNNRVAVEPLIAFGTTVYKKLGVSDEEAHLISDSFQFRQIYGVINPMVLCGYHGMQHALNPASCRRSRNLKHLWMRVL